MSRSHTISTSTPSVSPSQNTEKIGLDQAIKRAMTPKICRSQQEELTIKIQSLADELDIELPDDLSQIDLEVKQIYHLSNSGEPHPFWRMVELSTEDAGDDIVSVLQELEALRDDAPKLDLKSILGPIKVKASKEENAAAAFQFSLLLDKAGPKPRIVKLRLGDEACRRLRHYRDWIKRTITAIAYKHLANLTGIKYFLDTLPQFLKAVCLAQGVGRKDGSTLPDIYTYYKRFCLEDQLCPASESAMEKFLIFNSYRTSTRPNAPYFECPLTNMAYDLLTALQAEVRKGELGQGYEVCDAVTAMLAGKFRRIFDFDGSQTKMEDDSSEASLKYGGETDSCKGLVGTNGRKLHAGYDPRSGVMDHCTITSNVGNERQVLQSLIKQGVITKDDLVIADAGYMSDELFALMDALGIHYVIKGRQSDNPSILAYVRYQTHKIKISPKIGLSDWLGFTELNYDTPNGSKVLKELKCGDNTCIDAIVEKKIAGSSRLIKLYNPYKNRKGQECEPYVFIYTNLPSDTFSPMAIMALSKVRWGVEGAFRNLKQFCFMFFILMALVCYHIKVLMAQQMQGALERDISVQKACDIDETILACYLGSPYHWHHEPIPVQRLTNVTPRSKARISKIELMRKRVEQFGPAAWIFYDLKDRAEASSVSNQNCRKLKSVKVVGRLMALMPLPDITVSMVMKGDLPLPKKAMLQPEAHDNVLEQPMRVKRAQAQPESNESVLEQPKRVKRAQAQTESHESVLEQPERVKRAQAQPESHESVLEQPELVKRAQAQPESHESVLEQPELVKRAQEQPESHESVLEQPELVKRVQAQPESHESVLEQPKRVKRAQAQPESLESVLEQPERVKRAQAQPESHESVLEQPERVKRAQAQPESHESVLEQPKRVKRTQAQPESIESVLEQPERVKRAQAQPESHESVLEQPKRVKRAQVQPESHESVLEQPKRVKRAQTQPESHESVLEQPKRVKRAQAQPESLESVLEQPKRVKRAQAQPESHESVLEQPERVKRAQAQPKGHDSTHDLSDEPECYDVMAMVPYLNSLPKSRVEMILLGLKPYLDFD